MNRPITSTVAAVALLCLGATLPASYAAAQEKQRVSFKIPAENSKYTQRLFIDVGDAPGHQVFVYEIHRAYPTNPPVFNGVKLVESWSRATADYTDGNGDQHGYNVWVLENGDKFFDRVVAVSQSLGEGKTAVTWVAPITGGTGKFAGIRGVVRGSATADPKAGFTETQWNVEYWMEK